MFYSRTTGGFYSPAIHGVMPPDSGEITLEYHAELLSAQSSGKVIQPDAAGYPVALDPAPLPLATLIDAAKRHVRAMRSGVFYTLAGMQSEALAKGDALTANSIAGIQSALRGLPDIDLSACATAADVNAAFASAWAAIVAAAPPNVVSAFREVAA